YSEGYCQHEESAKMRILIACLSSEIRWPLRQSMLRAAILLIFASVSEFAAAQQVVTAKNFDVLPEADKRAVLKNVWEQRERAIENMKISSKTKVYNVEYVAGKIGQLVNDKVRFLYICELRRK